MALWLTRAGKHGEHEQRFLADNRIYLTWTGSRRDLSRVASREAMQRLIQEVYPDFGEHKAVNHSAQLWAFSHRMNRGDWCVLPSKHKAAINIGEIKGDYVFDGSADDPYYHWREVAWIGRDIPRTNFGQDLLYSFGAFLTFCSIERNDAEIRVRRMATNGWKDVGMTPPPIEGGDEVEPEDDGTADLEVVARDQIAKQVITKFKGHEMARLVDTILIAQGYTTFRSPEGPDKGVDILAAPGPLGFGNPRLCVQVKSEDSPLDRPTLDQLIGTMQNVHADQGLLVSWGGFKSSIDREKATQFFRVRLWDQEDLIAQLLTSYERLDEETRAQLPLKQIWILASPEDNNA